MDIVIERLPRDAEVELVVRGRLDAESAGELRHAVAVEVRRGMPAITLDLAGVAFLSSAGIRVLFETQREARASGGDCRVRVASEPVRKVLELTRLAGVLMQPAAAGTPAAAPSPPVAAVPDMTASGVQLFGITPPPAAPLAGRLHGSATSLAGRPVDTERLSFSSRCFAIGIGAFAHEPRADASQAGELVAAAGGVYHRSPQPFAVIDYLLGTGDLVPEADLVTGLFWEGVPGGRAGFEPLAEAPSVAIDELAAALLATTAADTLAVVIVGEVQGLVAAELIRPLTEATAADHPLVPRREAAARWLCFSREPVHAGRTAVLVGVISRGSAGPLGDSVAPLGPAGVCGHLHAVVFPHRPLRRTAHDLAAVLADLAASEPVAVVHLMHDDRPVLGRGSSTLVRGRCWFAPLTIGGGA
jgi:anti-sigma B factor antagonist